MGHSCEQHHKQSKKDVGIPQPKSAEKLLHIHEGEGIYIKALVRGLHLNTAHPYGTFIQPRTSGKLKWFRVEELMGPVG